MAEARIDVVIGSAQAQAGANAVVNAVNQVKTGFLGLGVASLASAASITQVWQAAKRGAEFEETMGRLDRQMGTFHSRAQVMVADLERITNGQITTARAAEMASRALAVGLTPDQVQVFAEAADAMGDVLGISIPEAFDQMIQAAATGRGQILANIGVFVDLEDEARKLAVATGRTTEQISRQERAMLAAKAITEQAGGALKRLSDGAVSDADRIAAVEAKWQNLWITIERGSKRAVIGAIDSVSQFRAFLKSFDPSKDTLKSFVPEFFLAPSERKEFAQGDAVFQQILGRAIVQDAQGKFGKAPELPPELVKGLPTALQGKQLAAERELRDKAITGEFDRTKSKFESLGQLYDLDAQRQILTAEDVVTFKTTMRQQELAKQGETLSRQLQLEQVFHDRRVKIGFESTEEKIEEEERYRGTVFEINQQILANVQAFGAAAEQNEAERAIARAQAEQARGQRIAEDAQKQFEIREAIRQRDFDATQTYYQGEIDMANARFASDEEIAHKERELLRAQLAFKLRLSGEEADRLIFLRKTGNFEGVRDILNRADPTLTPRAREGISESVIAKDIELQERATRDFFAGWTRGLQKYVRDTESSFGFAQDMARRTAQTMEQGFQRFFFDGMDGKFRGFKDVLSGVLDFTKQIVSQMAAQMMTVGIIKPGASALASLFGGGTTATPAADAPLYSVGERFGGIERFAMGGVTSRPRTMALGGRMVEFGEGPQAEAFVPLPDGRTIPVTMKFAGAMPTATPAGGQPIAITMPVNIINQAPNTQVEARTRQTSDGRRELEILVYETVNRGFAEGRFDRAQRRFGNAVQPVRR